MAQPLNSGALEALTKQWSTAEERIKHAGRVKLVLNHPAVKELRDAGYHLIRAIQASETNDELEELNRSLRHATRASYDAVESEIIWLLEQIRDFQRSYRLVEIKIDGLDYQAIRRRAREANKILQETALEKETRDQHYTRIFEYCVSLADDLNRLDDASEELTKKLRVTKWKIAVTVVTIVIAALSAGCAIYGHFKKLDSISHPEMSTKAIKP